MTNVHLSRSINADLLLAFAHQISDAASCMDWLKNPNASLGVIKEAQLEAPLHIQRLENIVHILAGDRIGEIYEEDEGEALLNRLRRPA